MCGIAGIVSQGEPDLKQRVLPMTQAQQHRGPDDWGVWSDDSCALGHRRLSIIDLSEAGRQPLSNDQGTLRIVLNGEIYNFHSLRHELEGLGHAFRTRTDTEVLLSAYEQWGTECVKRLRGMFAFAIWDQPRRRLFLARDRVGKKPLFYTVCGTSLLFASELQGLLADRGVTREVNQSAVDGYLSWGYVPAPLTGFRGIFKLLPAHWLTVEVTSKGLFTHEERYWRLEYEPKLEIDEQDAAEALREKLTEAVKLRMVSDVPLGAFLSGGIDSSVVVGLMATLSDHPVKTFSIGFNEADYDELAEARRVARRFGSDHHELVVEPDALAVLPTLVRHYGEPYADSSAIPTYYVSRLTRSSVTVALNGDGGDESFAGYERYRGNRLAEWARLAPGTATLSRLLPETASPKSRLRKAKRFLAAAAEAMPDRYGHWVGFFDARTKAALYSDDLKTSLNGWRPERWMSSLFEDAAGLDPVERAMAVDISSYLPYDLLVKVDITSMANGVEGRSPFLDHEVMELAARLPVDLKLRGRSAKYLVKRAFADLVPKETLRRRKMGFAVPLSHWLRGPLRDLLEDALLSDQFTRRGYFDPAVVRSLVREHLEGRADRAGELWNLIMLELWHREFLR